MRNKVVINYNEQQLDLSRPRVMGVLNVTPNSFSDGGRFNTVSSALKQAESMIKAGVDIIDVGGESTRPGAEPVAVQQELDRVIPIIESIQSEYPVLISCDTSKPKVMEEAVIAGVFMINDIRALQAVGAIEIIAKTQIPVCLMHMQGQPSNMQNEPNYKDVVKEVYLFLERRIQQCVSLGIAKDNILIDPGFGFGKSLRHNLLLLKQLAHFKSLSPILVGMSRKSMLGSITGNDVDQRLADSLAVASYAVLNGASIIRAHDVKETVDTIKIMTAIQGIDE